LTRHGQRFDPACQLPADVRLKLIRLDASVRADLIDLIELTIARYPVRDNLSGVVRERHRACVRAFVC
jgi:hypothetical protein